RRAAPLPRPGERRAHGRTQPSLLRQGPVAAPADAGGGSAAAPRRATGTRPQPGEPARRDRRHREALVKIAAVAERGGEVVQVLGRIVVGKDDVLERIIAGILANGHVLIEDYPGLAKTLIARLLAQALDLGFRRIQFTPDLLPSDITGSFLYDQREGRF